MEKNAPINKNKAQQIAEPLLFYDTPCAKKIIVLVRFSVFDLGSYKAFTAVDLTELGLFDLACGISWNIGEDDLSWAFISGQLIAELIDFFLGK